MPPKRSQAVARGSKTPNVAAATPSKGRKALTPISESEQESSPESTPEPETPSPPQRKSRAGVTPKKIGTKAATSTGKPVASTPAKTTVAMKTKRKAELQTGEDDADKPPTKKAKITPSTPKKSLAQKLAEAKADTVDSDSDEDTDMEDAEPAKKTAANSKPTPKKRVTEPMDLKANNKPLNPRGWNTVGLVAPKAAKSADGEADDSEDSEVYEIAGAKVNTDIAKKIIAPENFLKPAEIKAMETQKLLEKLTPEEIIKFLRDNGFPDPDKAPRKQMKSAMDGMNDIFPCEVRISTSHPGGPRPTTLRFHEPADYITKPNKNPLKFPSDGFEKREAFLNKVQDYLYRAQASFRNDGKTELEEKMGKWIHEFHEERRATDEAEARLEYSYLGKGFARPGIRRKERKPDSEFRCGVKCDCWNCKARLDKVQKPKLKQRKWFEPKAY